MNLVELKLPKGAKVLFNSLYRASTPSFLTQDLLAVELPNQVVIDVGWYPQFDPLGSYLVSVFRQTWENQLVEPIETRDIDQVVAEVERLAREFAGRRFGSGHPPGGPVPSSCSTANQQLISLHGLAQEYKLQALTSSNPENTPQFVEWSHA
jgi:hypothetical protein